MTFITCREREEIVIGEQLTITVLEVLTDRVRLKISSSGAIPTSWEQELLCSAAGETIELQSLLV